MSNRFAVRHILNSEAHHCDASSLILKSVVHHYDASSLILKSVAHHCEASSSIFKAITLCGKLSILMNEIESKEFSADLWQSLALRGCTAIFTLVAETLQQPRLNSPRNRSLPTAPFIKANSGSSSGHGGS